MSFPKGFKARTREQWSELVDNTDPKKKKIVTSTLRALGHDPLAYMKWTIPERLDTLMQAQEDAGLEPSDDDEDAEEAPPKKKGKAKVAKKTATKAAAGGADSAGNRVILARLDTLEERLAETNSEAREGQATLVALLSDAHFLIRVLVQSNAKLAMNSEDTDLQEALYQQLVVQLEGNED